MQHDGQKEEENSYLYIFFCSSNMYVEAFDETIGILFWYWDIQLDTMNNDDAWDAVDWVLVA